MGRRYTGTCQDRSPSVFHEEVLHQSYTAKFPIEDQNIGKRAKKTEHAGNGLKASFKTAIPLL